MRGKNHFIAGTVSGLFAGVVFVYPEIINSVGDILIITVASQLSAMLPDIDLPTSTVGKKVRRLSKLINKAFGHRTITHTSLWVIFYAWLLNTVTNPLAIFIIFGAMIGFISHIVADSFTGGGIAPFYPFVRRRIHLTKVKSGVADGLFTAITVFLITLGVAAYKYIQYNPAVIQKGVDMIVGK